MSRLSFEEIVQSIVRDNLISDRVNLLSAKMVYNGLSKNIEHTRDRIILCMSHNQNNFGIPYNDFLTNLEKNFKTIENYKLSFTKSSYLGIFSTLAALYQLLNPPRDINTYQYGPNPFCFGLLSAKAMLDSYENHKNYQRESRKFIQSTDPRYYSHTSQRGELDNDHPNYIRPSGVIQATLLEHNGHTTNTAVAIPLESRFRSIQNSGRGSSQR